jgi:hypothetical protein
MGEILFAYIQNGLRDHPISFAIGTASFLGLKRSGSVADHPPHLTAGGFFLGAQ